MTVALPAAAQPGVALLARSWAVLRAHPVVASALGGAVVLSMASMLFGIGVVVTPWFVCEIFALQLAVLNDAPTRRTAAWIRAGLLVMGLVGVVIAATLLGALAIGPDVSTADSAAAPLPWPEALRQVALIATVGTLTVGFIAPFAYAPLILIERGGRVGEAILESAWLVRRGGLLRHWALVFLAHLLPLAPAIVAALVVARTFERAATPLGVLIALPLLPLSIPLGQGLLSAAYVERRAELSERRWTRAEGRPPSGLVMVLVLSVLAPTLSVVFLFLGALRPAPPLPGEEHEGTVILARAIANGHRTELFVPDTTLTIVVDGPELDVLAGDGGGAGRVPRSWSMPITLVKVRRRGSFYAIQIRNVEGWWTTEVDRAANRVDDSVSARLRARLPPWALPAIGLAFALSALLLVRALAPLGALRRAYGAPKTHRPPLAELRRERQRVFRHAWILGGLLLVPGALALAGGLLALLG